MKSILKFITAFALFSSLVYANSMDDMIIEFEEHRVSQNPNIKLLDVEVNTKKKLDDVWYGYILDVSIEIAGKKRVVKDTLFTNGKFIAPELLDINSGRSLKDKITIDLTSKYYDESKLILGSHNAKDKVVVFSDPLCPFCMDFVPDVINNLKKKGDSIALYYYHFPLLRIHPAAGPLSKIMEVAKHKNIKDLELRVYEADWDKYFSSKEKNVDIILDGFNQVFKTNITLAEINSKSVNAEITRDIEMGENVMVNGTPTIFVNGKKDSTRSEYLKLGK